MIEIILIADLPGITAAHRLDQRDDAAAVEHLGF